MGTTKSSLHLYILKLEKPYLVLQNTLAVETDTYHPKML